MHAKLKTQYDGYRFAKQSYNPFSLLKCFNQRDIANYLNGTAQQALDQINSKGYALPYETEGRQVVKVGVQFNRETMTVGEYLMN